MGLWLQVKLLLLKWFLIAVLAVCGLECPVLRLKMLRLGQPARLGVSSSVSHVAALQDHDHNQHKNAADLSSHHGTNNKTFRLQLTGC